MSELIRSNHVCAFVREDDLIDIINEVLLPYVRNNFKIYLVADQHILDQVEKLPYFIDQSANLHTATVKENYEKDGKFDVDQAIYNLSQIISQFNKDTPFVILGSLYKIGDEIDISEKIVLYETKADNLLQKYTNSTIFCLYPSVDFNREEEKNILDIHNYCYISGKILKNHDYGFHQENILGQTTICMFCKKTKKQKGNWIRRSGSTLPLNIKDFSHGLCDSCASSYYN